MKVKNEVDKLTWRVVYFTLWIKVVIFVVFGTCVVQSFSQPPPCLLLFVGCIFTWRQPLPIILKLSWFKLCMVYIWCITIAVIDYMIWCPSLPKEKARWFIYLISGLVWFYFGICQPFLFVEWQVFCNTIWMHSWRNHNDRCSLCRFLYLLWSQLCAHQECPFQT